MSGGAYAVRMPTHADALDRLIIHDAFTALPPADQDILVLDDATGALTRAALDAVADGHRVIVRNARRDQAEHLRQTIGADGDERLIVVGVDSQLPAAGDFLPPEEPPLRVSRTLGRLPKSRRGLDQMARSSARVSAEDAVVVLGGNQKHMSHTMNVVLAESYREVRGGRGKGKHRCLIAHGPYPGVQRQPVEEIVVPRVGKLRAIGGVFSGSKADRGGSALADQAVRLLRDADTEADPIRILDLGSGNGLVSLRLAHAAKERGLPVEITATDIDLDAVASSQLTLGPRARVTWDDAAAAEADVSFCMVLLNPPFHEGTRIDRTLVQDLLDAAVRVLKPGGVLVFVHNSHLRYRPELEARFAETKQLHRDRMFTVLMARSGAHGA